MLKKYKVSAYVVKEYEVYAESLDDALKNYQGGACVGEYESSDADLNYAEEIPLNDANKKYMVNVFVEYNGIVYSIHSTKDCDSIDEAIEIAISEEFIKEVHTQLEYYGKTEAYAKLFVVDEHDQVSPTSYKVW